MTVPALPYGGVLALIVESKALTVPLVWARSHFRAQWSSRQSGRLLMHPLYLLAFLAALAGVGLYILDSVVGWFLAMSAIFVPVFAIETDRWRVFSAVAQ